MSERDKFLIESMCYGECCHVSKYSSRVCEYGTKGCEVAFHSDFSSWRGFGKLWEWAQGQEWYPECIELMDMGDVIECPDGAYTYDIQSEFVHPDRLANAVCEFLKEHNG